MVAILQMRTAGWGVGRALSHRGPRSVPGPTWGPLGLFTCTSTLLCYPPSWNPSAAFNDNSFSFPPRGFTV